MEALITFSKVEGIIPAIESAHALSYVEKLAPNMDENEIIVVTISGRGDKDMETIKQYKENGGEQNEQIIHSVYYGWFKFYSSFKTLTENGADIVEIGVPFSDPVADGPIIMKAGRKAIDEGSNINFIFDELIKIKILFHLSMYWWLIIIF